MDRDVSVDKNNLTIFLLILLILIFLINIFFDIKDSEKIDYLKFEITKVKTEVDKVYKENKILQGKVDGFKNQIIEIDKGIDVNNNKIQNLKIYEKEQISSFATYGNSEWEKYFADRYKE